MNVKNNALCKSLLLLFASVFFGRLNGATPSAQYGFIENKGQIIDQFNHRNREVLYLYKGNGLHVQLKRSGFSYEVIKTSRIKVKQDTREQLPDGSAKAEDITYSLHRVDILFSGSTNGPEITPYNTAADYINYYTTGTPESGAIKIKHYQRVLYRNIYPHIDVEFLISDKKSKGAFKYNFIVHPGGDLNAIQLKFKGATHTSLTADGHITIETVNGNIDESIPMSYTLDEQKHSVPVAARFKKTGEHLYGINAELSDPQKTLIIDPVPWATYYGGPQDDQANSITTDLNGNVIITGKTFSSSMIATAGAYQTTFTGSGTASSFGAANAFIVKTDQHGSVQWATYYGNGYYYGTGVVTDVTGNVYISGSTGSHLFLAKFNPDGVRIRQTNFGGEGYDYCNNNNLAIDQNQNLLMSGYTSSTTGIATPGVHQTVKSSSYDAFVAKFDSAGTLLWGTYNGGNESENTYGIAVDTSGNAIIVGETKSTNGIASTGAHQTAYAGTFDPDGFIAKFSPTGTRLWGTYYGNSNEDHLYGVTVDRGNNVIISGLTWSTGLATMGSYKLSATSYDAIIAKFNESGVRQWGTYYGGSAGEGAVALVTDTAGNIIITGKTNSTNGIATPGTYKSVLSYASLPVYQEGFLAKISADGTTRIWGTYYGKTEGDENCSALATDAMGNLFVTGYTYSDSFIATNGAYQTTFAGATDAFIAAFTGMGGLIRITNNSISDTQTICMGARPAILMGTVPVGGTNTFTYQWIDSSSATSGFVDAPGTSTGINYAPPAISTNTWYKRIVSSGGVQSDTSESILVTVRTDPNPVVGFSINNAAQCFAGHGFVLTDTTTISSGSITRLWDLGDGTLSHNASLTKTYTSTGVYNLRLFITSDAGCRDSIDKTITLSAMPSAGFIMISPDTQCVNGNSYLLMDTSHISEGSITRLWDFDDSTSSPAMQPVKVYSQPGSFAIGLTVTSNAGCKDSAMKNIVVLPSPHSGFTINNDSQCFAGHEFVFTDTSVTPNQSVTRLWTIDADTSSASVVTKTFTLSGPYLANLRIVNSLGCSDSSTQPFLLTNNPRSAFIIRSDTAQCLTGNFFIFLDTSSFHVDYQFSHFDFGDSSFANLNDPYKIYSTAGTYNVKLVSTSYFGCKDSSVQTITVYPQPEPGYTVNQREQCLNGNHFIFTDTSYISNGSFASRMWDFGNGNTDSSRYPAQSFSSPGTYHIRLTLISDHACRDSIMDSIVVYPQPYAGFTVNNNMQCLSGNEFAFADTSGTVTRNWDFGNGDLSSNTSPILSYHTAGIYAVKLVVSNGSGCADTAVQNVIVNPQPKAGFTVNDSTQCLSGNLFLFTDTSGAAYRTWDFGVGIPSADSLPSHSISYSSANTYAVKLVSETIEGCKDSVSKNITVYPQPAALTISGNTIVIAGSTESYSVPVTSTSTYNWMVDSGSLSSGNGTAGINILWGSATGNAAIRVIETSGFGCTGDTAAISILINNIPDTLNIGPDTLRIPSAAFADTLPLFCNTSWTISNPASWITFDPMSGSGDTMILVNIDQNTGAMRMATITFSTPALSKDLVIIQYNSVGLAEQSAQQAIHVYPNPSAGIFTLSNETKEPLLVRLYDLNGKLLDELNNVSSRSSVLDYSSLSNGIYILQISSETRSENQRLVIAR